MTPFARAARLAIAMPVWAVGMVLMISGTCCVYVAGWLIRDGKETPQ